MNLNRKEVPLINLAPKLNRPLSLWNPLDYLRILFWAFFFPQAIRWYGETFGKKDYFNKELETFKELRKALRDDPILRKLIIQAFIALLIAVPGICLILGTFIIPINWISVAICATMGMVFNFSSSVLEDVYLSVVVGLVGGVAGGVVGGVIGGVVGDVVGDVRENVFISVFPGSTFGLLFSMQFILLFNLRFGVAGGMGLFSVTSAFVGIICGLFVMLLDFGTLVVWIIIILSIFSSLRFSEWMLTTLYLAFFPKIKKIRYLPYLGRIVFLPLPGIQKNLSNQLDIDWERGIQNAHQLLVFSLQFIAVVKTIKAKFEQSPGDIMLARVSVLTNNLYEWKLFPALTQKPFKLYWKFELIPQLDTPLHSVYAGFWYWHEKEPGKAREAFAFVRNLRHGPELYNIAQAIDQGLAVDDMPTLSSWEQETRWLVALPDPELRSGTLKALGILHDITGEARVALNARSPLNRSTAVNRAAALLTDLIETGGVFCPEPEWPLIQDLAEKWKDIFTRAGGIIGEEVLRQPVLNPYEGYSGLPVTGSTFTGRTDILRQIEIQWSGSGRMPVLILYGHRRMGKTSILRSLAQNTDAHNLYVYLDLQRSSMVQFTGQLLRDIADALHKVVIKFCPDLGTLSENADFSGLDAGRRTLDTLLDRIDTHLTESQRLILAIDEFELIETGIHDGKLEPGLLLYLRAINQQYRWLGLIFAGLHTLEEMGRDYQSAFYGQAQYLRVSYLSRAEALKLITNPHPDFSLEYDDALIEEIYRLTFGQPYLVQLLCWELVNRWNERFLEKGKTTPRVLIPGDMEPILTPAFYQTAAYYFEGVWGNATKNEQTLLRLLARYPKPLPQKELEAAALSAGFPSDPDIMKDTLKILYKHDIITQSDTGIGFASELMRCWVQQHN